MAQELASKMPGVAPVGVPPGGASAGGPETGFGGGQEAQTQAGGGYPPEECLDTLAALAGEDPEAQQLIAALTDKLAQLGIIGGEGEELMPDGDELPLQ